MGVLPVAALGQAAGQMRKHHASIKRPRSRDGEDTEVEEGQDQAKLDGAKARRGEAKERTAARPLDTTWSHHQTKGSQMPMRDLVTHEYPILVSMLLKED